MRFLRSPYSLFVLAAAALIALLSAASPVSASHADGPSDEIVCAPSVYRESPELCPPRGPGASQADLAARGIELPFRPLPARAPSEDLKWNPYAIAAVREGPAPVFATLEDAVEGEAVLRYIEPGFRYISYIWVAEVDGQEYFQIDPYNWMRGRDLNRVSGSSAFQGLEFTGTPRNAFGWVLFERQSKRTPGFENDDYNTATYVRFQVVQVYAVETVDGGDWYLVGPDEWLEGRLVAAVFPNPQSPEGVDNGRWVEVNLAEQTIAVYDRNVLVFATVTATGIPGQWTRPGLFQAYSKVADETMSGSFTVDRSDYYYIEGVAWTVYFDAARALHAAYWHSGFGVPQSRGCVNLSTGDAQWIFNWIEEGDWIYVWDPTGETPTDPALYGDGGA